MIDAFPWIIITVAINDTPFLSSPPLLLLFSLIIIIIYYYYSQKILHHWKRTCRNKHAKFMSEKDYKNEELKFILK